MNSRQEPAPHARFGATLYFFVRDLFKIGRRARRRRAAETLIEKITDPTLPKLAIDCGANAGGVSARLLDAGFEVHAFEPDPLALSVLSERLGNRDGMTIIRSAVGAKAGCALLRRHYKYRDGDLHRTESSSIVDRPHVDNAHAVEVDVIDLCEYVTTSAKVGQ